MENWEIKSYEVKRRLIGLKDYLTVNDIVITTGFSASSIRRAKESGQLKAYQPFPRGKIVFRKDDVKSWIEGNQ